MATRARKAAPDDGGPFLTRRRIAAIVAQLGGWYTTWLFVQALGGDNLVGFSISIGLEWLLFEFKKSALTGQRDLLGVAAIAADALLNAGGMWAAVLSIDSTESYKMLSEALALGDDMRKLPALIIALCLGVALAIAPHMLWREKE